MINLIYTLSSMFETGQPRVLGYMGVIGDEIVDISSPKAEIWWIIGEHYAQEMLIYNYDDNEYAIHVVGHNNIIRENRRMYYMNHKDHEILQFIVERDIDKIIMEATR